MNWIRVEDRLPPYSRRCLVVWGGFVQDYCPMLVKESEQNECWFFGDDTSLLPVITDDTTVTHWQLRPAPPQDKSE